MRYASLDDVLNHFDHVVNLAGVDHVGIGSDFDGVGDSLPEGLKDVSHLKTYHSIRT
jgi:membrane dipeptidase